MKAQLSPITTIIICLLLLNLLGLTSLYSSLHQGGEFSGQSIFYRQIIWFALAWIFLIIFSFINYRLYFDLGFIFYAVNLLFLLIVAFKGRTAMGAQRWLTFGGIGFQPSELSKLVIILVLARFFSLRSRHTFVRGFLLPLILVLIYAGLIFKQPDLGTALIIVFIFMAMGFSSKVKKRYFALLIVGAIVLCPIGFNFLKEYQKRRLVVFLNPDIDPLGAGYTIIQSKIAIGSGKLLGKGFLSGTQNQFNFLPERHTDFIFTVIAEEWGLIGSLFILVIYWLILKKILDKTRSLKDNFARLLSLGISYLFFIHIFVNIGMTLGILPVVGLPLLFLSYGGTHLLVSFILMGIFINICRNNP